MSSPKRPARAIDCPAPKLGHDRLTCAYIPPEVAVDVPGLPGQGSENENSVSAGVPPPPPDQATVQQASQID
jgi:hypothetical protein